MQNKAINLLCTIGTIPVSQKAVKSLEIQRNYSDVANKFSLTLLDTPQTGLTDLELYMCAGNRTISIAYSDNPDASGLVSFRGQIWDYTSTFVGNIKQLTISGNVSRTTNYDQSGTALYNIDWNSYFCMRVDTTKPWNINYMIQKDQDRYQTWKYWNEKSYGSDGSKYTLQNQNVVFYKGFSEMYKQNAVTVKIKGPGGSIDLPVPDSFAPMIFSSKDKKDEDYEGDDVDSKGRLWGKLGAIYIHAETGEIYQEGGKDAKPPDSKLGEYDVFYVQQDDSPVKGKGSIRGFTLKSTGDSYIQMNPAKEYYGAGTFLKSNLGVDPSYIVKQLCKLEGWAYTESSIVQTATVPNSDSFKMNNMSALEFIQKVLIPVSITPVGDYTTKDGKKVTVSQGSAGFTTWFDSKGIFHYEPIDNLYRKDRRNISLGYNIPNSPVISFQVDTKGTCFYTTNITQTNAVSLVTGQEVTSIDTTQSDQLDAYNKVSGHNENLDNFFGYTYEEIQNKYSKSDTSASNKLYLGFGSNASIETSLSKNEYNENISTTATGDTNDYVRIVSSAVQKNLVTQLLSSAVSGDISTQLKNASRKIEEFMITATMQLWGDIRLAPASLISVTNMVKSTDSQYTTKHPTSGDYIIKSQVDKISANDFTQTLNLIRYKASTTTNINPQNIDYSVPVQANMEKTQRQKEIEEQAKQDLAQKVEEFNQAQNTITQYLNLWDEYMRAIKSKHPSWVWWKGDHPSICCDIKTLGWIGTHVLKSSGQGCIHQIGVNPQFPDPTKCWYTLKASPSKYEKTQVKIDPVVEAWYNKALDYKNKGKLGTKVLHQPASTNKCPPGIEYDIARVESSTTSNYQPFPTPNYPTVTPGGGTLGYQGFYQNQSNSLYTGGIKK